MEELEKNNQSPSNFPSQENQGPPVEQEARQQLMDQVKEPGELIKSYPPEVEEPSNATVVKKDNRPVSSTKVNRPYDVGHLVFGHDKTNTFSGTVSRIEQIREANEQGVPTTTGKVYLDGRKNPVDINCVFAEKQDAFISFGEQKFTE